MHQPPLKADPARVFRQLLRLPRPRVEIAFRFPDPLSHIPLYVSALSSLEMGDMIGGDFAVECVAGCLRLKNDRKAFPSVQAMKPHLNEKQFNILSRQVADALSIISPTFLHSDWIAWTDWLVKGARHPSNIQTTYLLGGCADVKMDGLRVMQRPDIFFGVPLNQLLDAHLLAYRAARTIYEETKS